MRSHGRLCCGLAGWILSALLVTTAAAQDAEYPISYGDEPAAAAADQGYATAGVENSGGQIYYRCCSCFLAGPLEGPDPWTLSPEDCPTRVGGWVDMGYHSGSDGLLNNRPGKFNLHQSWLWIERTADGEKGLDWGYRADIMYGIDGYDTQAFGNPAGNWDYLNGWDHGAYAWAMPQLYGTLASGNLNMKFGHFYTPMGYEVVPSPGNFFYSHALEWYNSEPFTHTGVLADYALNDKVKLYGGWSAGWDTGFDELAGGNAWLGGVSLQLSERLAFTYMCMGGNMGWRGDGYNHSLLFDYTINDRWEYVLESDLVATDGYYDTSAIPAQFNAGENNDQAGIAQYLFYKINYKLKAGLRAEWWKGDGVSYYEVTYGVNYKPIPNLVLRPEVRHQWCPTAADDFEDNTVFGIDGYVTF